MNKNCNEFICWARKNNWDIETKTDMTCELNEKIATRYSICLSF